MKENKTLRLIIVVALLLAIGIGIIVINKFQYSLDYSKNVRLEIYLGKTFEVNDILSIANDVYDDAIVQKAGPFQDTIAITVRSTSEEQNTEIINKINEKYETSFTVDDIVLYYNSNVRGRDQIELYIVVSIISGLIILLSFGVRYHKLGVVKILASVIGVTVGTQVLYLTLASICNMKINNVTIASGIAILIFCFMYLSANYEKALKKSE